MVETPEKWLHEFDKRYYRMRNTFISFIAVILSVFLSSWYLSGVRIGKLEKSMETLEFVAKDYMPAWYGQNMVRLMDLHTEKVIATLKGNTEEVKRIDAEFEEVIKIMQDNFIRMRGGMTTTTRSISNEEKEGSN